MAGETAPGSADGIVPKPTVKSFSCPKCGAAITINYPGTSMSAACSSCHSLIDVTDENYKKILYETKGRGLFAPCFPLGTRGELKGHKWEFSGFITRMDESSNYTWSEYLLYNPYQGYRWLTENSGQWTFVTMTKKRPTGSYSNFKNFDGDTYRIFYAGKASIVFVSGEFYWLVKAGQTVDMRDFICPPKMLSRESDAHETVWSIGEYIRPSEIAKAFKVNPRMMPTPKGTGATEPTFWSQHWKGVKMLWAAFFVVLTISAMAQGTTSMNKTVLSKIYQFEPNAKSKETTTTPVFSVPKDKGNLEIAITPNIDNSWLFLDGELVNDKTGETFPFDCTAEYYHGVDGGEGWSEGGLTATRQFTRIPGGDYYVNFDTESGDFKDTMLRQFEFVVRRDVMTFSNYLWCLFFISVFPGMALIGSISEETDRWSQSDFSPYKGGD